MRYEKQPGAKPGQSPEQVREHDHRVALAQVMFRKGRSTTQIARFLHVHRDTVGRYVREIRDA